MTTLTKGGAGMPKPEGRALAVAELLRAGHTAQQVSRALKVADGGGSMADAMAELDKPDEPGYLTKRTEGVDGVRTKPNHLL